MADEQRAVRLSWGLASSVAGVLSALATLGWWAFDVRYRSVLDRVQTAEVRAEAAVREVGELRAELAGLRARTQAQEAVLTVMGLRIRPRNEGGR